LTNFSGSPATKCGIAVFKPSWTRMASARSAPILLAIGPLPIGSTRPATALWAKHFQLRFQPPALPDVAEPLAQKYTAAPAAPPLAPSYSCGRKGAGWRPRRPNGPDAVLLVLQSAGENSEPGAAKMRATSCITMGLRKSGLSEPYLAMASAYGMRGQPGFASPAALPELPERTADHRLDWRRTRLPG
jgi:hypothetical protein